MEFINIKNIDSDVNSSLNVDNKLKSRYYHSDFINFINKSNKILNQLKVPNKVSPEVQRALHTIEKVLSMNISPTNYKDNGKLDIIGILRTHGDKLSTRNTKAFKDSLMVLLNQGLIESHDYFEAIKWISLKLDCKKLDNKCEDELIKSIDELDPKAEYK
ncbi:hypothetical protein [Clostridium taeniosporum]|uniref:Uncharacterized protein n=1 Tax=Clostridium taeniosporum TaxID=394958 RepID=A0A1D7XM42_9CLOT|nr:hypothetical protein [Clostridium taeniosporum]AOR24169.1 hypothetical protein BGI42_10700 [Clostridium taeniosporum]